MAETKVKTKATEKPEVKFGPPLIQTFEDAREAYLRDQITLEEFEDAQGKFGIGGSHTRWIPSRVERPDAVFENKLPDSYFEQPGTVFPTVEDRLKVAEEKEKVREAATKASEKIVANVKPEINQADAQNQAARKAAEKPEEKLDDLVGDIAENAEHRS